MNTQNKICLTHFDYDRLKLMISDHTKRNKVENNVKFLLVRSQSIDNSSSHDQMGRALTRSASLPLDRPNPNAFQISFKTTLH